MPEHRPLQPASPWVEVVTTDADWDAADEGLVANDLRPARLDPQLRAVRARARRRRPHPRTGPLQHRPGGRSSRLRARPDQRRLGQRLPPRPPPVPGQGTAPRRAQGSRPAGCSERRDARRAPAHSRRDRRARPRLVPRPRWVDAPAVEGSRRHGHQRDRRRWGPPGCGLRLVTPPRRDRRGLRDLLRRRCRPTSARPWRR